MYHKTELRKQKLKLRESMSLSEYSAKSSLICNRIQQLLNHSKPPLILSYSPIKNEVNVAEVHHAAHKNSIPYAIPLINMNNRHMDFYITEPAHELTHNRFGIKEPTANDKHLVTQQMLKGKNVVCLIPALAFDLKGNRIGYGKGFYDHFLHKYPNIIKIGLAFEFQIVYEISHSPHDVPMDMIMTDKRVIRIKEIIS